MEIPRLEKIVINMGLGDCKDNAKALELAVTELTTIAGQKPLVTKSKKSIANFKLREGMNVGAKVTLRGDRMYEFADKLVSIVLPADGSDSQSVIGTRYGWTGTLRIS
jgi:large subunit ribosomal protein L5